MPNDAKCGLVVGVAVVLTVAVVFFWKDDSASSAAVPVVQAKSPAPAAAVRPPLRNDQ
jgi:hypothetical protein